MSGANTLVSPAVQLRNVKMVQLIPRAHFTVTSSAFVVVYVMQHNVVIAIFTGIARWRAHDNVRPQWSDRHHAVALVAPYILFFFSRGPIFCFLGPYLWTFQRSQISIKLKWSWNWKAVLNASVFLCMFFSFICISKTSLKLLTKQYILATPIKGHGSMFFFFPHTFTWKPDLYIILKSPFYSRCNAKLPFWMELCSFFVKYEFKKYK